MENYTQLRDTISSKEGSAYITIDGKNRPMFDISKITAQLDLTVTSRAMLGHKMTQHKVIGAEGTGSMTMYFMNSDMLRLALQYIKSGKTSDIKIQITNSDSQSTVGRQTVILSGVIFNTMPITTLDDSSEDPITFDTDFTFDNIEGLEYFDMPENFR